MAITKSEALMLDHADATDYANKYINKLQNQITARSMIINLAIDEFNDFRNLPKSDSMGAHIWDLAFSILSIAVPAFRLAPFIEKMNQRATVALALATQVGNTARKARFVKAATRGLQTAGRVAEKIDGTKENVQRITEAGGVVFGGNGGDPPDKNSTRRRVYDLIAELQSSTAAWNKAVEAEREEHRNRVDDIPPSKPGLLTALMKDLLTVPEEYSESELDQIRTLYLWHMIGQYVQQNVTIKTTITVDYDQHVTKHNSIEGLNDNQKAKILELFGRAAPMGKIFWLRITTIEQFFAVFPCRKKTETNRRFHPPGNRI
jgi:hypothetical protein